MGSSPPRGPGWVQVTGRKALLPPALAEPAQLRARGDLPGMTPSTSYSPERTRTGAQSGRKAQHPSPALPALAVSAAPLLNLDQSSTPRGLQWRIVERKAILSSTTKGTGKAASGAPRTFLLSKAAAAPKKPVLVSPLSHGSKPTAGLQQDTVPCQGTSRHGL